MSFQLFTSADTLGALNLYSPRPAAFTDEDRSEGLMFVAHAAVALQGAQTEEQLRFAVVTRTVIGQAQGILMERFNLTAERAFDVLRRVSQQQQVKLRDVAERLVETRRAPGT